MTTPAPPERPSTPQPTPPGPGTGRLESLRAVIGSAVAIVANFGVALSVADKSTTLAGIFFSTTAIVTIAGNSTALGAMTGLTYHLPDDLRRPDPNPRSLLVIALGPVLAASTAAGLLIVVAAGPIAAVVASAHRADVAVMLGIMGIAVPCRALTLAALGATRGLGSMLPTVSVHQIIVPVGQLAGLALVLRRSGEPAPSAVALAWLLPIVVGLVLTMAAVRHLGGLRTSDRATVTAGEFWSYTRPRGVSAAYQIALERLDVILVSAVVGEAAAGVYGTLGRFVSAGNYLVFAMSQAMAAPLRGAVVAGRLQQAKRLLDLSTSWMVLVAVPYLLLLALKAEVIVEFINPDLVTGATALAVASVLVTANPLAGPVDMTLLMLGRSRSSMRITAWAVLINVSVAWVGLHYVGLVGAAVAWGVAVIVQNAAAVVIIRRHSELRPFGRAGRTAAVGAVVAVGPVALATPDTVAGVVISGLVAAVVLAGWTVLHADRFGLRRRS